MGKDLPWNHGLELPWNHGLFNLTLLSTLKGNNSALNPDFWISLGKKMNECLVSSEALVY